jgi:hypothetical protein
MGLSEEEIGIVENIIDCKQQVIIPMPGLPKSLVCGETRPQQSHCLAN